MVEPVDALKIKDVIQKVIESDLCLDPDSISLLEILSVFHEVKADKKKILEEISHKLDNKVKSVNNKLSAVIQEIDDFTNEICVVLRNTTTREKTRIYFEKKNNELAISRIKGYCKINNVVKINSIIFF